MSERRRNLFVLLLVFGLIAGSIAAIGGKPTKLGLDLQGGVSLVYQGKPTKQQPTITPEALDRAVVIIRDRVDSLGVAEPTISRSGKDQIEVDLPAVKDAERAEERVGTTAQLYFYDWEKNLLDEDCQTNPDTPYTGPDGTSQITGFFNAVQRASKCPPFESPDTTSASETRFYGFLKNHDPVNGGLPETSESQLWQDQPGGEKPAGASAIKVNNGILIVRAEPDAKGKKPDAWWVLHDDPGLSGKDIKNPEQNFDQQTNEPIVTMDFTDLGKKEFQSVTQALAQRGADNALPSQNPVDASQHFAIVLDNELVSVPYINYQENPDGIDGSSGAEISGSFTVETAQDLANFLKIGALPIRLELISRSQVSASLGKQALDQGLKAGIAGFAIVALFLLTFYRVLGLIAVGALAVYALYFYALVKLIPIVLTLPGIAGLILGLGVAADANIVIFERVKEEVRRGRSTGAAIAEGYRKGIATILDANVVTFLVAFILFILATAGVKGFAFTLGIGTLVSLFTAVLATQAILLSLRSTNLLRSRAALGATESKQRFRFDYRGASRWFFSASGCILLIGALAIAGKGLNFGIDFESGTRIQASLRQSASVDQVRAAVEGQGFKGVEVQTLTAPEIGKHVVQIKGKIAPSDVAKVKSLLQNRYGLESASDNTVGPTFGKTIANSAIVAIIASLVVIAIYIALRFQWKFAVPVLIALMHDILITGGVYALVGREVTASTVAALLTILGFSLYDTIIVFDRVRENIPRMPSATFSQIVNRSMSEVIVRSLATSFCTLLPVLALLLFGGETLKDFAFALIVGVASGAYSSVFIASPVLTHWKEREPVYKARIARVLADQGAVPAYAVTAEGRPVEVAPSQRRRRTPAADPAEGVSREEFDDLVANLGVETKPVVAPPRSTQRPAGGRRARAKQDGGEKPRKPRNTRHGRPR
ncbi:MAG: SecD/SecF fusion protein [Solirubrobacteraceae bacterium]|nr:SecD/SecF fusion protein [Solirubrobacteraceae bacterium]